jgi:RNA polymerase sigma-70 factor (ECF subfamily)
MEQTLSPPLAPILYDDACDDFDGVVRLHWPRIFRLILASVRDVENARNLTQECFARAWRSRDRFRGDAAISTWLTRIALNLVRSHESSGRLKFWRRAFRRSADVSEIGDWIPASGVSPEEAAATREQVEAVWTSLARLSDRQRNVFLLRFVEDMELGEIAAITGMKESTVRVHLFRALATPPRVDPVEARLLMPPTIVAEASIPTVSVAYGDPLGNPGPPSSGPGSAGGIGGGNRGGVGSGEGPGAGPGFSGGVGGGTVHTGGGVTAAVLVHKTDPDYSDEARKARWQGVVVLSAVIDETGRLKNIKVVQPAGMGLDEKALEAVQKWIFRPARRNGVPVATPTLIEVSFRLL